jgi:hypothetical protein
VGSSRTSSWSARLHLYRAAKSGGSEVDVQARAVWEGIEGEGEVQPGRGAVDTGLRQVGADRANHRVAAAHVPLAQQAQVAFKLATV